MTDQTLILNRSEIAPRVDSVVVLDEFGALSLLIR